MEGTDCRSRSGPKPTSRPWGGTTATSWHSRSSRMRRTTLQDDCSSTFDSIVRWAGGGYPGASYTFWIAPATLIFHGVYELTCSFEQQPVFPEALEMSSVEREPVDDQLGYDRWA